MKSQWWLDREWYLAARESTDDADFDRYVLIQEIRMETPRGNGASESNSDSEES